jgi:hypothetical protein
LQYCDQPRSKIASTHANSPGTDRHDTTTAAAITTIADPASAARKAAAQHARHLEGADLPIVDARQPLRLQPDPSASAGTMLVIATSVMTRVCILMRRP